MNVMSGTLAVAEAGEGGSRPPLMSIILLFYMECLIYSYQFFGVKWYNIHTGPGTHVLPFHLCLLFVKVQIMHSKLHINVL